MEALLRALEASPPGVWMRGAGVWTYAIVNLTHILGIATLFGAVLALDLRLMGLWRGVPQRQVETVALPLSISGFALAVASGVVMLSTNATEYAGNPFLVIKFSAIGLALLNALLAFRLPAWRGRSPPDTPTASLRIIGAVSLACWLVAISSGRMLGYW